MGYKVKKNTPNDAVVHFMGSRQKVVLAKATQAELKKLFEMKHPYIEQVK